jgi:ATP-binding cassette subfamily C protein
MYYIRYNLNKILFSSLLKNNIEEFEKTETSFIISKFNNDINVLCEKFFLPIIRLFYLAVAFILGLIYIFRIDYRFLIFAFTVLVISFIFNKYHSDSLSNTQKKITETQFRLIKKLKSTFENFNIIKLYRTEKIENNNFEAENSNICGSIKTNEKLVRKLILFNDANGMILFLGMNVLGLYFILQGSLTIGKLIAVVQATNYISNPLFAYSGLINSINSTKLIREEFKKLIDIKEKTLEGKDIAFDKIDIKDLEFAYENNNNVLKKVSFSIERNKKYALVGSSGSGKSTLLKILTKQLDKYSGSIKVNNHELSKISDKNWFKTIKVVSQKKYFLVDSVKNNITMYKKYNSALFKKSLETVDLLEVVNSLDEKEDYTISEKNIKFSGGELQRLNLARALYETPNILFLDETFSSLDNLLQQKIDLNCNIKPNTFYKSLIYISKPIFIRLVYFFVL